MGYRNPKEMISDIRPDSLRGLNVVLVNMPLRESSPPNCAPNGLCILGAWLKKYGASVSAIDLNAYRYKDIEGQPMVGISRSAASDLIERHADRHGPPDVFAISGMVTTLSWQEFVAAEARRLFPDAFIVSGNGLATEFREGLFNWIPELDAVVHSEGDVAILKVCLDALEIKNRGFGGALLSGKLDPYYVGEIGGRHRFVYDGGRPDDLDSVPFPDYSLIERDVDGFETLDVYLKNEVWGLSANNSSATSFRMSRSINTVSSRGCPFSCRFCFRGATGERNYGVRSAENLLKELEFYHDRFGVDFVGILDDNFMVRRDRIADIERVIGPFCESTGLRWGTHGRLDEAADLKPNGSGGVFNSPLRVDQMARAGCVYIGFGAESADPKIIKEMGKGGFILSNGMERVGKYAFPRTMVEGIKNTKKAGIQANCTWIMGYPGENLDNLKNSVRFVMWQRDFYAACGDAGDVVNKKFFVATAYPGTEMFRNEKVKAKVAAAFGVNYGSDGNPICDDALKKYVESLDDATKVMEGDDGRPVNFSEMKDSVFMKCRQLIDEDRTESILSL